ncbi:MAG: hypothetical protein ACRDWA_04720 [Acidimicrobiia bacterium]
MARRIAAAASEEMEARDLVGVAVAADRPGGWPTATEVLALDD